MLSAAYSAGLCGIDGFPVTVECNQRNNLSGFELVGLPDLAVKEAKERVKTACQNSGYPFPYSHITVNLAPASIKKAVKAAEYDLKWLVNEGIADEIDISIYAVSIRKVQLDVRIIKNGKDIFKNAYAFQWQGEIDGIRK